MANNSESGHAKNLTNLEFLISSITAFGESYNPSRESIQLTALQTLQSKTKESFNLLNTENSAYSMAVDAREVAFEPFGKLMTRVSNALKASETTVQVDESATTILRKLQGKRAVAKLTDEEKKTLEAAGVEVNQISVSQMSYDSRLDNLEKLISLLKTVPQYNPNEEDLKIDSLSALYDDLKEKNTNVVTTFIQSSTARSNRNEVLYKPLVGLVDVAFDTKTYIKSAFGASSTQYKLISKLSFVSRN